MEKIAAVCPLLCFILYLLTGPMLLAQTNNLGEGFFSPEISEAETLYFYALSNGKKMPQMQPADSITFLKKHGNYVDKIEYAPKDFSPFIEKLDYGVFILKVKRLGKDYHEVILNEKSGKTGYVSAWQGNLISWGQFLLNCHSVEFIDKNQKVFDHPMIKSAGRLVTPSNFRVLFIMGDWMEVEILADDYDTIKGKGWIRWKNNEKLLVSYNLFS